MDDPTKPGAQMPTAAGLAAALDWWRDAGVDLDFIDEPSHWLKADAPAPAHVDRRASAQPAPIAPPPPVLPVVDRSWPQDLSAFTAWWLNEPALDDGRTDGRIAPRGVAGAEFMVIVPEPEREDHADGNTALLAGPQGMLLSAMLSAMGIAPENAYLASVLPRHTPMADWAAIGEKGFGALLAHHISLVAPQRLIVLGSNILPLLGHDPAHSPAVLRSFNHEGRTIPMLAGKALAVLLERPRWKAGLWQGWLDWTQGDPGTPPGEVDRDLT